MIKYLYKGFKVLMRKMVSSRMVSSATAFMDLVGRSQMSSIKNNDLFSLSNAFINTFFFAKLGSSLIVTLCSTSCNGKCYHTCRPRGDIGLAQSYSDAIKRYRRSSSPGANTESNLSERHQVPLSAQRKSINSERFGDSSAWPDGI